jgi:hypothetical protein
LALVAGTVFEEFHVDDELRGPPRRKRVTHLAVVFNVVNDHESLPVAFRRHGDWHALTSIDSCLPSDGVSGDWPSSFVIVKAAGVSTTIRRTEDCAPRRSAAGRGGHLRSSGRAENGAAEPAAHRRSIHGVRDHPRSSPCPTISPWRRHPIDIEPDVTRTWLNARLSVQNPKPGWRGDVTSGTRRSGERKHHSGGRVRAQTDGVQMIMFHIG